MTSMPPSPGCKPWGGARWGGVQRYEDSYRLCYIRGPEGIVVMLAEQLSLGSRGERACRRCPGLQEMALDPSRELEYAPN